MCGIGLDVRKDDCKKMMLIKRWFNEHSFLQIGTPVQRLKKIAFCSCVALHGMPFGKRIEDI
jgi:hypothetical protein